MFFFYVLKSEKDGSFYKGQTDNYEDRLRRHNAGMSKATRASRPWKLALLEEYETRSEAVKRERFLKSPAGWREWIQIRKRPQE
jgi:putative endonuclease